MSKCGANRVQAVDGSMTTAAAGCCPERQPRAQAVGTGRAPSCRVRGTFPAPAKPGGHLWEDAPDTVCSRRAAYPLLDPERDTPSHEIRQKHFLGLRRRARAGDPHDLGEPWPRDHDSGDRALGTTGTPSCPCAAGQRVTDGGRAGHVPNGPAPAPRATADRPPAGLAAQRRGPDHPHRGATAAARFLVDTRREPAPCR